MRGLVVLLALALAALVFGQASKKKAPQRARAETVTGCVDQKEGAYVLTDDRALRTLLKLEWVDQNPENFARYVGRKVAVTGRRESAGDPPLFRVSRIKEISEICSPE